MPKVFNPADGKRVGNTILQDVANTSISPTIPTTQGSFLWGAQTSLETVLECFIIIPCLQDVPLKRINMIIP